MWCVPAIDGEFVERMEDVLRLYARRHDPAEPVVCVDERPVVLRSSERTGLTMKPGQPARTDYEYVRQGTANIFCIVEPLSGRRLTHATKDRTGRAFGLAMGRISRRYPEAKKIHVVMDNLSTHSVKSLVAAYGPDDGARLWKRFTLHYTPKHASWLNVAEMEASLVARECLGKRRIQALWPLQREVTAWNRRADRQRRGFTWKFRVSDARRVFRYDGIATSRSEH
jgi:DDE superfamily endonuclease